LASIVRRDLNFVLLHSQRSQTCSNHIVIRWFIVPTRDTFNIVQEARQRKDIAEVKKTVQTHNPAESSKQTFQIFKIALTAGSDHRAII
jgi:hypothetical protein